jgi:hypothetical protein
MTILSGDFQKYHSDFMPKTEGEKKRILSGKERKQLIPLQPQRLLM